MARQSSPLDIEKVATLGLVDGAIVAGGPFGASDFAVAGTFFLLRELEIACAGYGHVTFNTECMEVTWRLPASKNDPRAVGTSRAWGCVCSSRGNPCPYHSLLRQQGRVQELAVSMEVNPTMLPMFPTVNGTEIDKTAVKRK